MLTLFTLLSGWLPVLCASEPSFSIVYKAKEGKYSVIRTPQLLVTQKGTQLAFAQGRSGAHDRSDNDIILKRSEDGGLTWSPLMVIADQGRDALNSICVVQLRDTGRILVVGCRLPDGYEVKEFQYLSPALQDYQIRAGHDKLPGVRPGYEGENIVRNYVIHSNDDGQTWSAMRDITQEIKRAPPALWCVPGPGVAIQLQEGAMRGRIVVPCNAMWLDTKSSSPVYRNMPYAVFSDDGGLTWQQGELAPDGVTDRTKHGNETQMVELSDGVIMLNSRAAGRNVAISRDSGHTWSPLTEESAIPTTPTAAGLIRYDEINDNKKSRLLFSNPTQSGRKQGVISLSYDDGATWPVQKTLRPGRFSYSCLAGLPDGRIGCIFDGVAEKAEIKNYSGGGVLLAVFTLDWLTGNEER